MSSTAAIPIRRAGPGDAPPSGGAEAITGTPGGRNFYGSTPGGTRLVYSRDQLLSLASSPLSQTPPKGLSSFPPEISRSPDKHDKGLRQLASNRAAGLRGSGPGASGVDAFAGQGSASTNGTLPTAVARGPTTSAGQDATGIATGVDGPHLRQQNGTSDKGQEEQFEMDL